MKVYKKVINILEQNMNKPFVFETGGPIISAIKQDGNISVYFLQEDIIVNNTVWLVETGKEVEIENGSKYLGTYKFFGDSFILHVFYKEMLG